MTTNPSPLNRAESPGLCCPRASPYRSFEIFKECKNRLPGQLWVQDQLAVVPTCKALTSANPKCPIACGKQVQNIAAWKLLARGRLPWHAPNAIEAKQAEFRSEPKIPVGRLRNCLDSAVEKALSGLPRGVRVLTDIERWVQCESARTPGHQEA